MDITLTLNSRDFSGRLSTYNVDKELHQSRVVTTLDGTEHATAKTRDVITFRLIPYSDATATADYTALSAVNFSATYTDPNTNTTKTQNVRLTSNLSNTFGLRSIDGNRYYKGGDIVLRAAACN